MTDTKIASPLAKARGHGSAKSGTEHWWMVKVTSVILIPLTLWFFLNLMCLISTGAVYEDVIAWIQKPYVTGLMIAFLAVNFYHAAIGGVEVILDYVSHRGAQVASIMLYNILCAAGGLASIIAVLYIAFRM
ncbi:MAG TPA: succinate dehydrogenase, hydrophobic membrane anchor protein [Alphaproteobacteria bacterium]